MSARSRVKDSTFQEVETAMNNLSKVVGEAYLCETTNYIERQAFLDTILERLSRFLEVNISEVRFRRNDSTPINCLPNEILAHIFSFWSSETACFPWKDLLFLSWVCQRWRHAITNNATFWATIDFVGNVELIKTSLQRSKEAKLRIEINDQLFRCPEKLALVKSILITQAHRIKRISATLRASNINLVGDALFQSFPSLRYLILRGDYYRQLQGFPFTPVDAINLEVLDLFGCSDIPWTSLQSILCVVRKLKIRFDDQEIYLNFFAHLHSFSQLKVLSVHCCFVSNLPRLSPITLHGLTCLIIDSNVLIPLVDSLRMPNLRRLTICDEINYTFHSDLSFDYTYIHYITLGAFYMSGFFRFYVVGSSEKDDIPDDYLWDQEFHLPDSSSVRRFQVRMHFNQASTGYLNILKVLNDVLSKTTAVREVCLPSLLPDPRCGTIQDRVPLSIIMECAPRISRFALLSTTSASYVFGR